MAALNVPLSLKFQIGPHESEQTDGRTVGRTVPRQKQIFRIERKVGY